MRILVAYFISLLLYIREQQAKYVQQIQAFVIAHLEHCL